MKARLQRFVGRSIPVSVIGPVATLAFPLEHRLIHGEIPAPTTPMPNILHFTLNKAASQNTGKILGTVLRDKGYRTVWPNRYAFISKAPYFRELSIDDLRKNKNIIRPKGLFLAGIGRPIMFRDLIEGTQQIVSIRDPRDILVSAFYSIRDFHPEPNEADKKESFLKKREEAKELGIDKYVLKEIDETRSFFEDYKKISSNENCILTIKYEDFLEDFDGWLAQIEAALALPADPKRRQAVNPFAPQRPTREDSRSKIRSGSAGQFAKKLRPETVAVVERELADVLDFFGYR